MRFLGRKVYLGVIVVLITALEQGLPAKRRRWLIEALDISLESFPDGAPGGGKHFLASRCWQTQQGNFIPPVKIDRLPDALLKGSVG